MGLYPADFEQIPCWQLAYTELVEQFESGSALGPAYRHVGAEYQIEILFDNFNECTICKGFAKYQTEATDIADALDRFYERNGKSLSKPVEGVPL